MYSKLGFIKRLEGADYLLGGIFFLYFIKILVGLSSQNFDTIFGYLDHQSHWESVNDLLRGKILYRDFFWEYGLLTLIIRVPFFILFGSTFFSSYITDYVFLPVIGITLSYILARQFLSKPATVLFMFLLLLFGSNSDHNAIRHLIPELGLLLTLIGLENNDRKKTIVGSTILSLSLLSSVEYTFIAHICIGVYLLVQFIRKKITFSQVSPLLFTMGLIGGIFFIYLLLTHTLTDYFRFHMSYATSFFTIGPCSDVFPRWYVLGEVFKGTFPLSKLLMNLNLYIIPLCLLGSTLWLMCSRKMKYKTLLLILMFFSLGIYIRTVTSPCYLYYNLVFPFFLLSYFIFKQKLSLYSRIILIILVCWFIVSSLPQFIRSLNFVTKDTYVEKTFVAGAGGSFSKHIGDAYNDITKYIQSNTSADDYIFVYPNGPYYELTGRKNATDLMSIYYYQVAPYLRDTAINKLHVRQPKYLIINTLNGPHYLNSVRGIRYNVYAQEDLIVFDGEITPIEEYITRWYALDKTTDVAWILKRRTEPIEFISYYQKIEPTADWQVQSQGLEHAPSQEPDEYRFNVTNQQPSIFLSTPQFAQADVVRIPVQIDFGSLHFLRKYGLFSMLITQSGQAVLLGSSFMDSSWQTRWIYLPAKETLPESITFAGVALQLSQNEGFLPGGKPRQIRIRKPEMYILNPDFVPDQSAIPENAQ